MIREMETRLQSKNQINAQSANKGHDQQAKEIAELRNSI
jgi:hypothetical protein